MNILLGVSGSVAATLTPKMLTTLQEKGHIVRTIATNSALNFKKFDDEWGKVYTDEWEWDYYNFQQSVGHIELVKWADVFVIAPCTANTLAKIANGICDNLLTNCVRAWPCNKRMIIAPAMNCVMWDHPTTARHIKQITEDIKVTWVDPTDKVLFCGDSGVGAMGDIQTLVDLID